jgi:hypothetical protein
MNNQPLTRDEAKSLALCCDSWPGGLGCALVPSRFSKRGYKNADWGWRGRIPGNFNYAEIPAGALLCPVTRLGVLRNAINFKDHLLAYGLIRAALITVMGEADIKARYNQALRLEPKVLAARFQEYANRSKQ